MFASEKKGSGDCVISKGIRFSRKTAFTKRLIAVEVFKPTLEQNVSKLVLSFSSTRAVKVASAIDTSPFTLYMSIILLLCA